MAHVPRLLVGFLLMTGACLTGLRWGGRPVRMAALVIGVAWTAATLGELVTDFRTEAVIGGDIAGGLGLLVLAASFNTRWLWAMTLIEALLFLLHAWFYAVADAPSRTLIVTNNVLATLVLVVLTLAALQDRSARRRPSDRGEGGRYV